MLLVALVLTIGVLAAVQASTNHSGDVPYTFAAPDSIDTQRTLACLHVHVNRQAVAPSIAHIPGREVPWFELEAVGNVPPPGSPAWKVFIESLEAPDGFLCLALPLPESD